MITTLASLLLASNDWSAPRYHSAGEMMVPISGYFVIRPEWAGQGTSQPYAPSSSWERPRSRPTPRPAIHDMHETQQADHEDIMHSLHSWLEQGELLLSRAERIPGLSGKVKTIRKWVDRGVTV